MAPTPEAPAPAITSKALTWWKYDVAEQQSQCALLSTAARGIDAELTDDAWSTADGSCTVLMTRLLSRCKRAGFEAKAIWLELQESGRWSRSADGKVLTCTWLLARRTVTATTIEKRRYAGQRSGAARKERATTRRKAPSTPAASREHVLNTCSAIDRDDASDLRNAADDASCKSLSDSDMNTCSTHAEQKRVVSSTLSLPTVEKSVELTAAAILAPAATSPAASHADGAAALVAEQPRAPGVGDYPFRAAMCDLDIAETTVPMGWVEGDLAELVHTLEAADTGVDVERALYRLCSRHQRVPGDDGHLPLLDEMRALLDGAGGRDGLIDRAQASRVAALALHGANAVQNRVAPLLLRAIATATFRELQQAPADAEPRRIAAGVAYEFMKGRRHASGFTLPCDALPVPERLMGHRVAAGAS